jgi:hypothetical protein
MSAAIVWELTQKLEAKIKAWRHRPLTKAYPYLMADAQYECDHGGTILQKIVDTALFWVFAHSHLGGRSCLQPTSIYRN